MEGFALLRFDTFLEKKSHKLFTIQFSTKVIDFLHCCSLQRAKHPSAGLHQLSECGVWRASYWRRGWRIFAIFPNWQGILWYCIFKFLPCLLSCFWKSVEFLWRCFAWCQHPGTRKARCYKSWPAMWSSGRHPCPWRRGLEWDDLWSPLQPKPLCNSMKEKRKFFTLFEDAIHNLGTSVLCTSKYVFLCFPIKALILENNFQVPH